MIMVVVYFTFLCETLQTFCFPLQAFQGMDQIKKGFLSKGMFQRLFERFSFCVVLFIIVRCSLTSGAKVVTSLIKSPHWVNLSQHHAVTNGSKITTLYWTRVADSSPGFSLDILGTRKKNVRDNLYLFSMQLIRVGFSFVAFKTSAVLFFSLLCIVHLLFQIWCQLFIARDRFTVLQIAIWGEWFYQLWRISSALLPEL